MCFYDLKIYIKIIYIGDVRGLFQWFIYIHAKKHQELPW